MSFDTAAWAALPPLQRELLCAHALGATARPLAWLAGVLADPALREAGSPRPNEVTLHAAQAQLRAASWLELDRAGLCRVDPDHLAGISAQLLARVPIEALRGALARADGHPLQAAAARHERFPTLDAALAWVRLEALGGASPEALNALAPRLPWSVDGVDALLDKALWLGLDDALFARLHPALQRDQLLLALRQLDQAWLPIEGLDLPHLIDQALARDTGPDSFLLRWAAAEHALLGGEHERIATLLAPTLEGDEAGPVAMKQAFDAAIDALDGRWAQAENRFDEAMAALRRVSGKRRGLLAVPLGIAYVMALLAERQPAALQKALKFCLAEGGSREPVLDSAYGFFALALQMHLGERPRDAAPFMPARMAAGQVSPLDPWRWLMRAWLKQGALAEPLSAADADAAARLAERLRACGLYGLLGLVDGALRVLGGEAGPPGFFIPGAQERWQTTLAALKTVVQPESAAAVPEIRLLWLLRIDDRGRPEALTPHEQKSGPRGWGKPKEVPLSRLQRSAEALGPQDGPVARTIKQESWGRSVHLDLAAALPALAGHPALAFEDAPEQPVELSLAAPELDVMPAGGGKLRVRMLPPMALAPEQAAPRWAGSAAEQ
ncbi:MAG TPA: hypothetical protein VGQ91_12545, partial [Ideonella sp.]|nr:hypothetical protein [Ideonella sp.]